MKNKPRLCKEQTAKTEFTLLYLEGLAEENELVVVKIVGDGVGKGDAITIADRGNIDASSSEFIF